MRRCVLFLTNLADGRTRFARGVLAERPLPQPRESKADHLLTMLLACEFGVTCLTFESLRCRPLQQPSDRGAPEMRRGECCVGNGEHRNRACGEKLLGGAGGGGQRSRSSC